MRLAVIRDVFMNESDAMTFQSISPDLSSPVDFWGRRPSISPPPPPGLHYCYYGDDSYPGAFEDYDVVDVAELYHTWGFITVINRATKGLRTFVTIWDNIPYNMFVQGMTGPILSQATGFIARSTLAVESLKLYVDPGRIFFCPAAVDTDLFLPSSQPPEHPTILYAGRLTWEKGIGDLLHACRGTGWKLLIAGGGPLEPVIRQYAEIMGLDVEMLGQVPHAEMPGVLQRASVFCYPSLLTQTWVEQFGISVIEAMSCGLPCVTTDVGAFLDFSENAKQCGLEDLYRTVPPMRFDLLRESLAAALEMDMVEGSMRTVAERYYSSRVVGERLREIYGL